MADLSVTAAPPPAAGDLAARTVILVNSAQPDSVTLGEFYATQRGIPAANLIALPMPDDETITWRTFVDQVWQPLQDELLRRGWLDGVTGASLDPLGRKKAAIDDQHLAFLVVCRGTPLRIEHDPTLAPEALVKKFPAPIRTNQGAVDSELSLLALGNYDVNSYFPNPLFAGERSLLPDARLIVKVARLDGPTLADARGLVTSARVAERNGLLGRYYVDLNGPKPDPDGDKWLEATHQQLEKLGFEGDVDHRPGTFGPAVRFDAPVLYFGWYADSLDGPFARPEFRFPPGAVALHIHSYSARTLRSTTEGWCGPLVARGVAATVGNVFEPYLQLTHRPDLLLQALARGENLGDAAYFALPALSWQAVLIGDPLYRPFKVPAADQEKMLAQLPPALAPYAVAREARLLFHAGKTAEADLVLRAGRQHYPGLVLALTEARLAVEQGDNPATVAALESFQAKSDFPPADWTLAREAAGLLARHGAAGPALAVYSTLARTPAPTREARRELLVEARTVADDAGDTARRSEFEFLLKELSAAP
jgi:uncharacterized protein (TIGR03790 family)